MTGRKVLCVAVALCMALACCLTRAKGNASEPRTDPRAEKQFRVLCMGVQPPWLYVEGDRVCGIYVDLMEEIGRTAGMKFIFSLPPVGDARISLATIRPDLVLGVCDMKEKSTGIFGLKVLYPLDPADGRLQDVDGLPAEQRDDLCLAIPFVWQSSTVFHGAGESRDLRALQKLRLAVVSNSCEEMLLDEAALRHDILRCESIEDALESLRKGECDALIAGTLQGKWQLEQMSDPEITAVQAPLHTCEYSLIVLRGDVELAQQLSSAIQTSMLSGRWGDIQRRWMGGRKELVLSPGLMAKVACLVLALIALLLAVELSVRRKFRAAISERDHILDFVRDGILATDATGTITMLNRSAKKLLSLEDGDIGHPADDAIPGLGLQAVIRERRPVYDLEQNLRGAFVCCNKVPVLMGGRLSGAIVTLRDLSELQAMAEEMTGVKMYVESLRVHNHEFMNTLQAISGLIQLKQYDRALEYIAAETDSSQNVQSFMSERIKNAAVCGVVMGKAGVCREQGIEFVLSSDSSCADHGNSISDRTLVIIVGNLLQNAIEVLMEWGCGAKNGLESAPRIDFSIYDDFGYILLSVRDNAGHMTPYVKEHLFDQGFSTKEKGRPSGYGLYSIRNLLNALDGDISVDYEPDEYTDFTVSIPIPHRQEAKENA